MIEMFLPFAPTMKTYPMAVSHSAQLLRYFRYSGSVTYFSMLFAPNLSASCIGHF